MAKVKTVDIDDFLTKQGVEIVIHGKPYLIRDIPIEVQKTLTEIPVDYKKVVCQLLGLDDDSILEDYGIVALTKVVNVVHENLLQGVLKETPSKD